MSDWTDGMHGVGGCGQHSVTSRYSASDDEYDDEYDNEDEEFDSDVIID